MSAESHMLSSTRPALRAAVAATLGNIGLGLLVWIGISTALLQTRGNDFMSLRPLQNSALLLGLALVAGFSAWLLLARDTGGTRARPRALASLGFTLLADVALLWLLAQKGSAPGMVAVVGAVLCIAALATLCLSSIALETASAQLLVPAQLALALQGGSVLFFALMSSRWPGQMESSGASSSLLMLSAIAAALMLALWLTGGGMLPWRARRERWIGLALLLGVPLLLYAWLMLLPAHQRVAWWLAMAAVAAAQVLDRGQRLSRP
ncbi:MAG TPA: hypothetical protein DDZ67_11530 [Xanthomonadaceae bacterium]|nr:hypothetical protein [Xanthomonadaceae bacterium]